MLKKLTVKNFAIIEDLVVDFESGMTVLTGQTGAGKSLIIDTISLLLGARADSDMIRYGANKAYIEGVFSHENNKINEYLKTLDIPILNEITILREIGINSKNIIKINNVAINLINLKNIASLLADIHVQHDTYRLFNPETYLSFIDLPDDDKFNNIYNNYLLLLDKYQESKKEYENIKSSKNKSLEKLEYYEFQIGELNALDVKEKEDEELEEQISKLSNYDKIFNNLNEAYSNLENEYFSLDNIYNAYGNLNKIKDYDKNYMLDSERLDECFSTLEEIRHNIKRNIDNLDFDANELNMLNERLNEINSVKSKYKMTIDELLAYHKKIKLEVELVTNYDQVLSDMYNALNKKYIALIEVSKKLTDYRKKRSKEIEKAIVKECRDLELPNTKFEIIFNDIEYNDCLNSNIFKANGVDEIDFMLSLNLGEPLKSLHKTASGGEMSRIMLAFKSYFSQESKLSLMVFDEIDSGVSGTTALQIAKKMKSISEKVQVLCITHLPQVAAKSDHHLYIYKEENSGRTTTHISNLSKEDRIEKLAIMLSGEKISKFAIEHAKELLEEV